METCKRAKARPPPRPALRKLGEFASGTGLRLVEWELDRSVMELDVETRLLNGAGVLHGGCLSTAIDAALTHAAIYCTVPGNIRSGATVNLTVNFVAAVKKGSRVTVEARKTGGGRNLFFCVAEAHDDEGRLVATGQGCGRYRPGSHDPAGQPATGTAADPDQTIQNR